MYDQNHDPKRKRKEVTPEDIPVQPSPDQEFVEFPPVILKCNAPMQPVHPTVEEVRDEENDIPIPILSKGKQRENSADPGCQGMSQLRFHSN